MSDQYTEHDAPQDDAQEHVSEAPEAIEAEEQDAPPAKSWSDDDESEARLFGWKAPEEWQGEKPAGYIDNPSEYMQRVERSRIFQTMTQKNADLERKLGAMNEKALERQRQEYESRMQALTQMQRRAVDEADTAAYDRAEQAKVALQREQQQHQAPQGPAQEVVQYREANEWTRNPVLWHEATEAVNVALQHGIVQTNDPKTQIEYAEQVIRTKYPHLFNAQSKAAPRQKVDGGGLAAGPARSGGAFEKLPAEAKHAFERQMKQGIWSDSKKDREEYAREYNAA